MSLPAAAIPAVTPPPARWRLLTVDEVAAGRLAQELGVPSLVARLLVGRGHGTPEAARAFLEPDLHALHDPFLLLGMDRAVERIVQALDRRERITVYGDYDVDGVTSTASLVSFLRACGADVDAYIPRRLEEGYGLNVGAVERLAAAGTRLLVTCDCGVTAVDEVDRAVALGVDVVIIDHHRVPAVLPKAVALLNPYQPGCAYPFPHLAAVGVTFKLLMALRRTLREAGWFRAKGLVEPRLKDWLDLVALGTVADVVPLKDENRVLVAHGLPVLARTGRPGLRALAQVAGVDPGTATAGQIGFRLGPRINAAGRLADARAGLDLLLTAREDEAFRLAVLLDEANRERQEIEAAIVAEAVLQAEAHPPGRGLVLAGEGWHPGVVGIVASRIVERFHRPALVLGLADGVARGSGRSIPAFHLHDALAACGGHLTRFGGHRAAAGLELPEDALEGFRQAFLAACADALDEVDLVPRLNLDAEVRPEELDGEVAVALERLGPFGMGNPTPLLLARDVRLDDARRLSARSTDAADHLKGRVGGLDAIGFGMADALDDLAGEAVDVAFTFGLNRWRGTARPQLVLKALAAAPVCVEREPVRAAPMDADADAARHVHT